MNDYNSNFLPSQDDLNMEEELDIDLDECRCSECEGTFFLEPDKEITECPLCHSKFDCKG